MLSNAYYGVELKTMLTFKHEKTIVRIAENEEREKRSQEHNHPRSLAIFSEHFQFEPFTEEPSMNHPFTHSHTKKNSKHPTTKFHK